MERRVAAKKRAANAASSSVAGEKLEETFEKSLKISEAPATVQPQPSLAIMFLAIMSIFSILNQIHYKPPAQS